MDPIHSLKLPSIQSMSICMLETAVQQFLGSAVQCLNADILPIKGALPPTCSPGICGDLSFLIATHTPVLQLLEIVGISLGLSPRQDRPAEMWSHSLGLLFYVSDPGFFLWAS